MKGLPYITSCQRRFSRQPIEEFVKMEYEKISTTVKNCLDNNQMSITDTRAKQAFSELEHIIYNLYSTPLPRKLYRRAQREYKIVKGLQQFLHTRPDIIVRPIDKGKGVYIGTTAIIESKIQAYMDKTEAYKEINNGHCLLADNLHAVQAVLDYLVKQKTITKARRNQLSPNLNNLELAHFYSLVKVHKVTFSLSFFLLSPIICFSFL
jgi:predicted nucleic acid-binding protein